MSMQTVESVLDAAEHLSFSERLTLMQRLLDGLKKAPQTLMQTDNVSVQQQLKQVLAKPARRQLHSLELDTRDFQFNREEANER